MEYQVDDEERRLAVDIVNNVMVEEQMELMPKMMMNLEHRVRH